MEIRNITPKKDALVVRSNKLIEARYETTLHQQRIMLWLISEIRPEDRDFQKYRVTIKELAKFVGLENNKNVYQQIAAATAGMVGRLVEIGSLEDDEYLQVSLVSSARYRVGQGFIDLSIDPTLTPYLLDLKANFTTAYLRDLMAMKSAYSIRLYDLLNQYRKIRKRSLSVAEIKTMLRIEKKYKEYKNFKARVIAPAVAEINDRTDLYISYRERKSGRSVETLDFTIQVKEVFKETADAGAGEYTDHALTARMLSHGIKENEARKYINLYGESDPTRISGNLDKLEEGLKAGKVKKPGAWFRRAVDEDYRDQISLFQKNTKEAEEEAQQRLAERLEKLKAISAIETQMETQEAAYTAYRMEFVRMITGVLSDDERSEWETAFADELGVGVHQKYWLKEKKWDNRIILPRAEKFIFKKTKKVCLEQEEFYKQNNFPDIEELQRKREALL